MRASTGGHVQWQRLSALPHGACPRNAPSCQTATVFTDRRTRRHSGLLSEVQTPQSGLRVLHSLLPTFLWGCFALFPINTHLLLPNQATPVHVPHNRTFSAFGCASCLESPFFQFLLSLPPFILSCLSSLGHLKHRS